MSNYQKQILELNTYVKTYIAPSPIHGVGVFALRDIPKGQKLYTDIIPKLYNLPAKEFKNLFPEVKKHLMGRWPQVVNGSAFGFPDTRIQAFLNHSYTPNYDAKNDVALVDIKQGEEVTEDYREIPGWEKVFVWITK
jgi:SET domain-containing protein